MTGNRQRTEGAQVTPIFERQEAERDYDEQNSLLVNVPAEEERGIAAECHGRNKGVPCGLEKEFDEADLDKVRFNKCTGVEYLQSGRIMSIQTLLLDSRQVTPRMMYCQRVPESRC